MTVRVAINGFGRIGRNILRAIAEAGAPISRSSASTTWGRSRPTRICCVSTRCTAASPGTVTVKGDTISVGNGAIKVAAERDPSKLPWKDLGIDIALECTGLFTAKDKASAHLTAGAKRVLVSAPADGAD